MINHVIENVHHSTLLAYILQFISFASPRQLLYPRLPERLGFSKIFDKLPAYFNITTQMYGDTHFSEHGGLCRQAFISQLR